MSEFKPYKDTDYDVVNEMLNELKSKEPTVKSKLIEALNANFNKTLAKYVKENNDVKIKIFRHGENLKKYTTIILILMVPFQLVLTILCFLSLLTRGWTCFYPNQFKMIQNSTVETKFLQDIIKA